MLSASSVTLPASTHPLFPEPNDVAHDFIIGLLKPASETLVGNKSARLSFSKIQHNVYISRPVVLGPRLFLIALRNAVPRPTHI